MKYLFIFLLTFNVFAKEKISVDKFLKMIDNNEITFDIEPLGRSIAYIQLGSIYQLENDGKEMNLSDIPEKVISDIEAILIEDFKSKYVYFDPKFLNVRYIVDKPYKYSVVFDFYNTKKCSFRVDTIDPKCGNPICDKNLKSLDEAKNLDLKGTDIPDKYCEKLYNVNLKKMGEK